MAELRYGEEATKSLLSVYLTPDVVSQREKFLQALSPQPGERVLDLGSGPGFLTSSIAQKIGLTGVVCGIDVSEPMIELARGYCAEQPWVDFSQADIINLPFPDNSFDAAISVQVLEYVPDVEGALAEMYRVVCPAGRVVIVDTDWDSIVWHSSDRERMNRVLSAWEEHAADPFLPRTLPDKLSRAGFCIESLEVVPLFNPRFHTNTYSNRLIDLMVPYVTDRLATNEADDWAREIRSAGNEGTYFFSLNRYLFVAKKPT